MTNPSEPKMSSRKSPAKKTPAKKESKKNLAVVRVAGLPHEFSEREVRAFFGQFGAVYKLRLSRSKRTARSKGYAFIQFELPEVAEIVANATNNYFIGGKPIRVEHMNPDSVWPELFKGHDKKFRDLRQSRSASIRKGHNANPHGFVDESKIQKDEARAKKLSQAGIEYEFVRTRVNKVISKPKKATKQI